MRILVALLALVATGLFFVLMFQSRMSMIRTGSTFVDGFDIRRHAFVQGTWTLSSDDGEVAQRVTLFGTVRDVLSPWVEISHDERGLSVVSLGGGTAVLPPEAATVWRDADGSWQTDRAALPDLGFLDAALGGGPGDPVVDIFAAARAAAPEHAELLTRIEADVARREANRETR